MSSLQNKCVAGVCWCCRRLAQLCYEYSLAHYKNTCNNPSVASITWRVKNRFHRI